MADYKHKLTQLQIARIIAKRVHGGRLDKSGNPEIFHPQAVAEMCETTKEKCAAWLHDVIEDSCLTLDDLKEWGVDEEILAAVGCITRDEEEDVYQYLVRVASNDIAAEVKLHDMQHNSSPERLDPNFFTHGKRLQIIDKYATRTRLLKKMIDPKGQTLT